MGFLQKARYMSSNSGSSWFNIPFSYQEAVPVDIFLGRFCPPEKLTPEHLKARLPGSFGEVVATATVLPKFVNELRRNLGDTLTRLAGITDDRDRIRAWSHAVGKAFLSKHGLGNLRSTFALEGASKERAMRAGVKEIYTAMRSGDMPFPIVAGCVVPREDRRVFYSYEFTPLYCGVPARIEDSVPIKLGGILVEPFAASSEPPDKGQWQDLVRKARSVAKVKSEWVMPLTQAAGISSGAIAQTWACSERDLLWEALGSAALPYWNGIDFGATSAMGFADGGATDNLAIFPPLRRGIGKLVICDGIGREPVGDPEVWKEYQWDLMGYFGAVETLVGQSSKLAPATLNENMQVFDKSYFEDILQEMFALHRRGHPLILVRDLPVLPNKLQGIAGGYTVRTVWIFNGGAKPWMAQLPGASRALVEELAQEHQWPYVPTSVLAYTAEMVNALEQLACWNMRKAEFAISELFKR